ncbi:MAG: oligoendopeptidase F, partial [Pseudomonadota bacterium]
MTRPLFDASSTAGSGNLGDLPEWDLTDLYPGPDAPEWGRDMDEVEAECASFAADYEGALGALDGVGMLEAVRRYEAIQTKVGRLMSYAGLRYYQATTDGARAKFMSDAQDAITAHTTPLVFYSLEINRLDDSHIEALFDESAELARYRPVFERLRAMKPHQLSDELEKFLHDQSSVGASAWNKLFDETIAGLTFTIDGKERGIEATLNLLSDRDRAKREAGARELARVFGANSRTFARIHNTL